MRFAWIRRLDELDLGHRILAVSTIAFGVACFLQRDFTSFWNPAPAWLPARQVLAYVSAALLVLSGLGLLAPPTRRAAAMVQVVLFVTYAAFWLAQWAEAPAKLGPWLGMAEQLGIAVAAVTVAARSRAGGAAPRPAGTTVVRMAYGVCSIVFGLSHLVGVKGTAAMVPVWVPGDGVFWAVATGVAHIAVGAALLLDRLAVPATRIAGIMYLGFAAFVWAPGAVTHPDQWLRWGGLAISLVLMGAVWRVGDHLAAREP